MHSVRTGTGKPLVLVHGLGSSAGTWDPVVPALGASREVIAVDLPGFGRTPPLAGEVTIGALTDAVADFLRQYDLSEVDVVGSSMGAQIVLELARRGHAGTVVALDPGGFWNAAQAAIFGTSLKASITLVRRIQPLLPRLTANPVGRTSLLGQFSAKPWKLPHDLVLQELRGFTKEASPSLDAALTALVKGPRQEGMTPGTERGKIVIGWGRHDRVTLPSQAKVATAKFPTASLHWFAQCGHFPHWDQPEQTVQLILDSTA